MMDHVSSCADVVHPVTGTGEHFCLADNFHKKNLVAEANKLRDPALVPQLRHLVNNSSR